MPDYFSHFICAEKILERLDQDRKNKITSPCLYLLGAQGGDVFFAYNFKFSKTNLGRELHTMNVRDTFEQLTRGNPSYAAGFATHYALDCTFHPIIYAYEETRRHPLAHQQLESDLGLYISKFYGVRRRILPREQVLSCTSPVYDSLKPLVPYITVTGIERCLKRYFNYTRYLFKTKKQTYKCDFDFTTFAGAVDDAVALGVKTVNCVLSGDIPQTLFEKSFLER